MAGCCSNACTTAPSSSRFRRILWIALAVNAVMFLVEIVASHVSRSMALQADALDFLGDSLNYALSLIVLPLGLAVRARAAWLKGLSMALFGAWVLGSTGLRVLAGEVPDAPLMGGVGLLALAANVAVAVLLFRFREGDSNMRSVWLCSRNDAIANVAVIAAAGGVFATASHWPDLVVAAVIAALCLHSAVDVLSRSRAEMRAARESVSAGDEVPTPVTGSGD